MDGVSTLYTAAQLRGGQKRKLGSCPDISLHKGAVGNAWIAYVTARPRSASFRGNKLTLRALPVSTAVSFSPRVSGELMNECILWCLCFRTGSLRILAWASNFWLAVYKLYIIRFLIRLDFKTASAKEEPGWKWRNSGSLSVSEHVCMWESGDLGVLVGESGEGSVGGKQTFQEHSLTWALYMCSHCL